VLRGGGTRRHVIAAQDQRSVRFNMTLKNTVSYSQG
jgi:hypothetical protein